MAAVSSSRTAAMQAFTMLLVFALVVPSVITDFAFAKQVHALAGDFNGDGVTTPGLFVDGLFILSGANDRGDTVTFRYGRPDDVPVVGDWTGDGLDTVGVVRRGRHWHLRFSNSGGNADRTFTYGSWLGRDRPVVGDWIGKGRDLPGIVRGSTWHLRTALDGGDADITFTYGRVGRGDHPVAGDWNGNGIDTAGIVRSGWWHLKNTHRGGRADWTFAYGRSSDVPVAGSWDGRGRDTPGVVRGTTWLLKKSLLGGSADIALELSDPTADAEVEPLRRPAEPPRRVAPSNPAPEPAPSPEPDAPAPEPAPSPEPGVDQGGFDRTSIGSPEPAGVLSFTEGLYRLSGGGADIWGTADSFEFAQKSLTGDATVIARVISQEDTNPWAKAGLMVRDDSSVGSRHVSLFITPSNGVALQYRGTAGGASSHIQGPSTSAPTWLRLDRTGDTFRGYASDDAVNWKLVAAVTVPIAATALVGLAVTSHSNGVTSEAGFADVDVREGGAQDTSESGTSEPPVPTPPTSLPSTDGARLLYSPTDVARYTSSMTRPGPYFSGGDAGHGGPYSPNDGQRSVELAKEFLANPQASYWTQPGLPYSPGDPWPSNMAYVRPMHAAWIYMTQPENSDRLALRREVKALLLHHASHPSLDFSDANNYPVNYPGYAPSPIFGHAHWMTRLIKARDMLGRDSFSTSENASIDRWFYDYANWTFKWLHKENYVKKLPGRESRDYSTINMPADASRKSYDGGPKIGSLAMAYTNRQAANAATASLAANYLEYHGYTAPASGGPSYGRFTLDQLLHHSRLFFEETIRFSVFPQGLQGDFERGDRSHHAGATPQTGWEYSTNVLANLAEMAEFHGKRGDMSLWNYGTTGGYDGTAGTPTAGGFAKKNLHFYAWSMSRYVNNGWNRTNDGQPLALPHFYRDVIPAATVARFAPDDTLLRDAWRRSGSSFPPYPQRPASQGIWDARFGEGAKHVGLLEQAVGSRLDEK